jgi:hypothetical protein
VGLALDGLIYLIGLIVVIMATLSFFVGADMATDAPRAPVAAAIDIRWSSVFAAAAAWPERGGFSGAMEHR